MPTVQCKPGNYSSTGFEPCINCHKGYYQPLYGQKTCLKCVFNSNITACDSGNA